MKKIATRISAFLIPAMIVFLTHSGCSEREKEPVILEDSTIVYPSSEPEAIDAKITLCKTIRKNGKRVGSGTVFTIKTDEFVRACVDLENIRFKNERSLTFHIDWLDADENSVFLKRIDLSPSDSTTTLVSSVSINPDKRLPGDYKVRVYLFRELIAEKKFRLISEAQAEFERLKAKITLCSSVDKETHERIGIDSVFTVGEKEKIRAFADITDPGKMKIRELAFLFEWVDTTGKSFYRKEIELPSLDSAALLTSAISISPENRQPGHYILQLYLADELITQQRFELKPAPPVIVPKTPEISATITLCRTIDKKTGEPQGVDTEFILGTDDKVRAIANIGDPAAIGSRKMEFHFEWFDTSGKSFYKKKIEFMPGDSPVSLSSSIAVSPEKREPGVYTCKLYLFKNKIAEKKFTLKK